MNITEAKLYPTETRKNTPPPACSEKNQQTLVRVQSNNSEGLITSYAQFEQPEIALNKRKCFPKDLTLSLDHEISKQKSCDSKFDEALSYCKNGDICNLQKLLELHPILIDKEFNSSKSAHTESLLACAVKRDDVDLIDFLIQFGKQNISNDYDKKTDTECPIDLLDATLKKDNLSVVKMIMHGANVNGNTEDDTSPLTTAVKTDNFLISELLIRFGANVNIKTKSNMTPLHFACQRGNTRLAELLIRCGANPELPDRFSRKPLHCAILSKQSETSLFLIKAGADINARLGRLDSHPQSEGSTPLHLACDNGLAEVAHELLRKGADPNAELPLSKTPPLALAIRYKHPEVVRVLTQFKANPDISQWLDGLTPQQFALLSGQNDIAAELLKYDRKINVKPCDHLTHPSPHHEIETRIDHLYTDEKGSDLRTSNNRIQGDTATVTKQKILSDILYKNHDAFNEQKIRFGEEFERKFPKREISKCNNFPGDSFVLKLFLEKWQKTVEDKIKILNQMHPEHKVNVKTSIVERTNNRFAIYSGSGFNIRLEVSLGEFEYFVFADFGFAETGEDYYEINTPPYELNESYNIGPWKLTVYETYDEFIFSIEQEVLNSYGIKVEEILQSGHKHVDVSESVGDNPEFYFRMRVSSENNEQLYSVFRNEIIAKTSKPYVKYLSQNPFYSDRLKNTVSIINEGCRQALAFETSETRSLLDQCFELPPHLKGATLVNWVLNDHIRENQSRTPSDQGEDAFDYDIYRQESLVLPFCGFRNPPKPFIANKVAQGSEAHARTIEFRMCPPVAKGPDIKLVNEFVVTWMKYISKTQTDHTPLEYIPLDSETLSGTRLEETRNYFLNFLTKIGVDDHRSDEFSSLINCGGESSKDRNAH